MALRSSGTDAQFLRNMQLLERITFVLLCPEIFHAQNFQKMAYSLGFAEFHNEIVDRVPYAHQALKVTL